VTVAEPGNRRAASGIALRPRFEDLVIDLEPAVVEHRSDPSAASVRFGCRA
jgi:hypothetical protein